VKYYGEIGYAEPDQVETAPGVWEDLVVERNSYGEVLRNNRRLNPGDTSNLEISAGVTISIIADPYSLMHFADMRYIKWLGRLWTVSTADATQPPRINLTIGGVYNGPTAPAAAEPTRDFDGERT
jgi:hypothetical protein